MLYMSLNILFHSIIHLLYKTKVCVCVCGRRSVDWQGTGWVVVVVEWMVSAHNQGQVAAHNQGNSSVTDPTSICFTPRRQTLSLPTISTSKLIYTYIYTHIYTYIQIYTHIHTYSHSDTVHCRLSTVNFPLAQCCYKTIPRPGEDGRWDANGVRGAEVAGDQVSWGSLKWQKNNGHHCPWLGAADNTALQKSLSGWVPTHHTPCLMSRRKSPWG